MWFRAAQLGVPPAQLDQRCKQMIRTNPFFQKMFRAFGVDMKQLWQIKFVAGKLDGMYAEFRGDKIVISEDVLAHRGLANTMFLVAHELVHWLTEQKQREDYFADPEEVEGLDWAIAYELSSGKQYAEIETIFLPLALPHFNNEQAARQFLVSRFKAARNLLRT